MGTYPLNILDLIEGFEGGSDLVTKYYQSGGTGTRSYDATSVKDSRYSLKMASAAQTCYLRFGTNDGGANGAQTLTDLGQYGGASRDTVSFHFMVESLPGAGQDLFLCEWSSLGTVRMQLKIDGDDGTLWIWARGGGAEVFQQGVSAYVIQASTWYQVTVKVGSGNTTPSFTLRDLTTGATLDSKTHSANCNNTGPDWFSLGSGSTQTGTIYYDNLAILRGTSSFPDDPIPTIGVDYAIGLLQVAGAGTYNDWTGTYANLDELPPDGVETRTETTLNERFTDTFQPTSSLVAQVQTVYAVGSIIRAKAITGLTWRAVVKSGTTVGTSPGNLTSVSDTYERWANHPILASSFLVPWQWDPDTGIAWTVSAVDALELGVKKIASGGTTTVDWMGFQVLYSKLADVRRPVVAYHFDVFDGAQDIVDVQGRAVPLNEVRADRWVRVTSVDFPSGVKPTDYADDPSLAYLESVTYQQTHGETTQMSLRTRASQDDFVDALVRRISQSGGGV